MSASNECVKSTGNTTDEEEAGGGGDQVCPPPSLTKMSPRLHRSCPHGFQFGSSFKQMVTCRLEGEVMGAEPIPGVGRSTSILILFTLSDLGSGRSS